MGKRKAYTPFSTSSEAGVTAAPVEGFITVDQEVRPTVDTGFIDSKGTWIGRVTSDKTFSIYQKDEAIANGGTITTPSVNPEGIWPLDMTGFRDLFVAVRPTNGGAYQINAVMGPDSVSFANLSPVNAAGLLRGNYGRREGGQVMQDLFKDSGETMIVDVWNIYSINESLANQKLLMFSIVNNSGGVSTIETAYLRVV